MTRSFLLLVLCLLLPVPQAQAAPLPALARLSARTVDATAHSNRILARAFRTGRSEFPIRCQGRVTRLLDDDDESPRHQRFILRLATGQTLLIAHNIDLAPRIDSLKTGDRVTVQGEYIWNNLGGLIHHTHRDPDDGDFHGFIRHEKKLYR